MKDFNKIVNKLGKKGGNVILKQDIFDLIDPECKKEYMSLLNKTIYRLRAEGYILSLKSGVYIVPDEEDRSLNSVDLIEKYYIKLLKRYITSHVGSQYYISGSKSLGFHLKDMSIPERIYIINRKLNKKIKIGTNEIIFKTLSGKCQGKKVNLYNKFSEFSKDIEVDGLCLKISGLELSLLESALVSDIYEGVDISMLMKAIKKYGKVLSHDTFREIGKYKYNMSFNRLKEISKTIDRNLYELFLDIIKTSGGCFVGEGLRGM